MISKYWQKYKLEWVIEILAGFEISQQWAGTRYYNNLKKWNPWVHDLTRDGDRSNKVYIMQLRVFSENWIKSVWSIEEIEEATSQWEVMLIWHPMMEQ